MLASGAARLIPRLVSCGKHLGDAKRNQQEQFDNQLCNVFWGFSSSAGEPLRCSVFVVHSSLVCVDLQLGMIWTLASNGRAAALPSVSLAQDEEFAGFN